MLAQVAAPPAKPAETAKSAPKQNAAAAQSSVPWDDEIERIASQRTPRGVDDLRRIQQQVQAVVQHARPAVVAVQMGDSVGSGVIVNAEGLVLTAGHVAMKPNRPVRFLFPDGSRARGVTLGLNQSIDSGMMKITDEGPWPFVKVAKSNTLNTGDWVIGLGQPNGYFRDRAPPVRLGRVLYQDDDVVNSDVTLVGGDSGGPLLNLRGEVVGIHSRIGRRITSNFHVPISTYELTWDRLLAAEMWGNGIAEREQEQYRTFLGIIADRDAEPCRVKQVAPGTPAALVGIKPGDVITQFGDEAVDSFAELAKLVQARKPGARVRLVVEREGETLKLNVRLSQVGYDYPGAAPIEP
ncbi:MAG: trypsin-like peptidase domain-containing protein [Planctomycetota bacterium]